MKNIVGVLCTLGFMMPTAAIAVEVVRTPLVQEGELSFGYTGQYQYDNRPTLKNIQLDDFSVGYGVTDRWRTRMETEFTDQAGSGGLAYKYVGWINTISLTGNDSPLPTALFTNITIADHAYAADYVTAGLAMLKELGPITNTANLFLKHEFGDTASGKPSLQYRFQAKYNVDPEAEPGFELFGDTAKQSEFDRETLKLGPGLFGSIDFGSERLGYELAFLVGATPGSPNSELRWRMSYTLP